MANLIHPGIADSFQRQLDDLQRSYAQLGKIQQPLAAKHEFTKVPDIEAANEVAVIQNRYQGN